MTEAQESIKYLAAKGMPGFATDPPEPVTEPEPEPEPEPETTE